MTAAIPIAAPGASATALGRRGVLVLHAYREEDRRRLLAACAIATLAIVLGVASLAFLGLRDGANRSGRPVGTVGRLALPKIVTQSAIIYDTGVIPLAEQEAAKINAERPVDLAKVVPARPLRIAPALAAGTGYAAAVRCLTQAVYYEAASEPTEGQRAVAQVVINRMRHPAFPNTICGVVFQGSQRVTGCQFSFTCDGSLARVPSIGGWARAERVAREALAGTIAPEVGNATHYHANYVVPYWAPTLNKAATIGAHIFYTMRGYLGSASAFRKFYDIALEAPVGAPEIEAGALVGAPPALSEPLDPGAAVTPAMPAPIEDDRAGNLVVGTRTPQFDWSAAAPLRADEGRGALKSGAAGSLKADDLRRDESTVPPTGKPDQD